MAADVTTIYKLLEAGWFASMAYTLGHFFIKMTLLLTYIRIFTLRLKWFKWATFATMFYVTGWSLGVAITLLVEWYALTFSSPKNKIH